MAIQIFGTSRCFDTKKAERWFKERRIGYQSIDLIKYGLSGGEFDSVLRAVGGCENLFDPKARGEDAELYRHLADTAAREDLLYDNPRLMKTPIVRNGKKATVGYCPEVWETWK